MLALEGKGSLTPYTDELKMLMDTVMHIHEINSKKHPFMSYQKYPEKSDSLPENNLNAIYRHLLAYLSNKTEDEYGTHMESIACRLWMFTVSYYRCNNHMYNLHEHDYINLATKDRILDVINHYNSIYLNNVNPDYIHFAAEPLISLYKVLNSSTIPDMGFTEDTTTKEKHVAHLQVFQTILHTLLLHDRWEDTVTDELLLHEITIVDLLVYHFLYSFYYFRLS